MRFVLALCFFSYLSLQAKEISLEFLKSQPAGYARDFYIWYFINQDSVSIKEAKEAYELVFKKSQRIEKAMQEKGAPHELPKDIYCKNLPLEKLVSSDAECISIGLKFSSVWQMEEGMAKKFANKLLNTEFGALGAQIEFLKLVQKLERTKRLEALFNAGAKDVGVILSGLNYQQKLELLDSIPVPQDALLGVMNGNDILLNRTMGNLILDFRFKYIKQALDKIEVSSSDSNTFFLLGINAIMQKSKGYANRALSYFKKSQNTANDPFMQDRALWWQYLVSKDKQYLKTLSESGFVDIFSITANQVLNTTPKFSLITDFKSSAKAYKLDIKNPFAWQNLRTKIGELKDKAFLDELALLYQEDTFPHLIYFLNRQYRYQHNYFIFAYDEPKLFENAHQKALTYAVARQESNLLPALVSTSYALGMMQIMPFNVEPFAKSMGLKNITLFDMFDPKIALKFGNFYLKELEREFKNPLFVAYAYNGGPGFLRRTLAKNQLFLKDREYEPWLSMELLAYEESRFYGMKVLANYVIYSQMLGEKIDVQKMLNETLKFQNKEKK